MSVCLMDFSAVTDDQVVPLGGAKWELFAGFAHDSWHKVRQFGKRGRFCGRLWHKVSFVPIPWVG